MRGSQTVLRLKKPSVAVGLQVEAPKREPIRIIVDSNALFIPLEFKIDLFVELQNLLQRNIELILLSSVKQELETLASKKTTKTSKQAQFALTLAQKCTLIQVKKKTNEQTDETILRTAQAQKLPVLTNDKTLKQKLRDISVPVIYLRQKSRLAIDGLIK